jgi:DNA invertase Pin-like site-specific DNA recombinase
MTLKAAIYRRVSTPGQQDNTSLADQLDLCRDYAEAQGYEVVADYCDVYTGADIKHRPRINDALRDAAAGHFEVFIVNHTDRLTREPRHQGYILTNLEIAGVRFESVGNPLDDSIAGMSQEFAHSLTSRVERDRIKERTMAGRAKRIRDGKLQPGSNPLFGYAFDDAAPGKKECYVEDATTSWVIRRVFREVVEGRSLRQIAEGLNANAIPTPKAKSGTQGWTAKQIKDIVKHPFYRGFAVANRWTSFKGSNGKRRTLERPESEWSALPDTVVPRLVDDATWHAANERLQRNKVEKTRPYDDPSDWLLRAGFVYCATCGCRMGAKRHSVQEGQTRGRLGRGRDARRLRVEPRDVLACRPRCPSVRNGAKSAQARRGLRRGTRRYRRPAGRDLRRTGQPRPVPRAPFGRGGEATHRPA